MIRRALFASVAATVATLVVGACSSTNRFDVPTLDGGLDGGGYGGAGIGQACTGTALCRPGLACNAGMCAAGHSTALGGACVISAECTRDAYCGPMRTCAPAGTGVDNAACMSDGDCAGGLRCGVDGLSLVCHPEGAGDVGAMCKTGSDCYGGLACSGGMCAPLPLGVTLPVGLPTWQGATCPAESGPTAAYFRVPRNTPDDGDFFRLPFPNDVRRTSGRVSLTGFPTPGSEILGYDLVDRYVKDVEAYADGFSAYGTVTMRFSGALELNSLKSAGAVRLVDLTTQSDLALSWSAISNRTSYVCPNSVSVRPGTGAAYVAGHTYAAIITTTAKATGGTDVVRPTDLVALLGATAPTDAALTAAYAAYAPMRAWATAKSVSVDTILDASVFTIGSMKSPMMKMGAIIDTANSPQATGWVKCDTGVASPCPDATAARACAAADPDFDELHALVALPVFQKGTAPYDDISKGGDVTDRASGNPSVQRTEQVCMSLTIPKGGTMPAAGWPLVIYAHGTGGSFRSNVTEGVSKSMTAVDDGAGGLARVAVLGIDQVAHGPRRGGSMKTPDQLFFAVQNPLAARGNALQGAADQLSLVRFAKSLDLVAASSPTGARIKFDRVAFWGHSQGATEGGIAMPYTTNVVGAAFSGSGASLIDSLLTKTSPVNIAQLVPFLLVDQNVTTYHPVLSLLQNSIDPADPLSHARGILAAPSGPTFAKHTFVAYGQKDTFATPQVQATFILAGGLGLTSASPTVTTPDAIGSLTPVAAPATPNFGSLVGYAREYAPSGYDGHFVAFQNADGKRDMTRFLGDVTGNRTPRIGR